MIICNTYELIADALEQAARKLRNPRPGDNGIAPCGCGGEAILCKVDTGMAYVACTKCGFQSKDYLSGTFAVTKWNTGMGAGK